MLRLPPDELRALGHRIVDLIADHHEGVGALPPTRAASPAALRERLGGPPPDEPGDAQAALDRLLAEVLPYMQHGDHPRYFARVPGPSNAVGALADALGAGLNVFAGSWTGGSGPAALELVVLGWLRDWCGMPPEAEGILVSGGSIGSLTALAVARDETGPDASVWCSDQTHSSVLRALRLLGLAADRVHVVPSDRDFRLPPEALERADGPAIVVANAGTTNTGAVDPLEELADRAAERGWWLHVDGAYGAPAVLTERGSTLLAGIGRADSLVLDPHKWLFQPYEIGAVLVRRPGALERTFTMFPEYLRDVGVAGDEVAFRDRGPQLTRGSRALKLWLSLQVFGLDAFRAAIDRGLDLAERAQELVAAVDGFEIVTPAQLAIVNWRAPDAAALVERIVADGFAAPSSTVLRGETVLRMCTINPRTTDEDLELSVRRMAELAAAAA